MGDILIVISYDADNHKYSQQEIYRPAQKHGPTGIQTDGSQPKRTNR